MLIWHQRGCIQLSLLCACLLPAPSPESPALPEPSAESMCDPPCIPEYRFFPSFLAW